MTPLSYDEFKQYEIHDSQELEDLKQYHDNMSGIGQHFEYRFRFPNNYGASVVKHQNSYGYEDDLFELAVLHFYGENSDDSEITYSTDITEDVIGWLSSKKVRKYLRKIMSLNEDGKLPEKDEMKEEVNEVKENQISLANLNREELEELLDEINDRIDEAEIDEEAESIRKEARRAAKTIKVMLEELGKAGVDEDIAIEVIKGVIQAGR